MVFGDEPEKIRLIIFSPFLNESLKIMVAGAERWCAATVFLWPVKRQGWIFWDYQIKGARFSEGKIGFGAGTHVLSLIMLREFDSLYFFPPADKNLHIIPLIPSLLFSNLHVIDNGGLCLGNRPRCIAS